MGSIAATSSGQDFRMEAGFRMPAMHASSSVCFLSLPEVSSVPLDLCRFTGPPAAGRASLRAKAGEEMMEAADL
jgi:hypothetical protein